MASVSHLGYFPFCIRDVAEDGEPFEAWDGDTTYSSFNGFFITGPFPSKSSESLITVYGEGTDRPYEVSLKEAMFLFWNTKKTRITLEAVGSPSFGAKQHDVTVECSSDPLVQKTASAEAIDWGGLTGDNLTNVHEDTYGIENFAGSGGAKFCRGTKNTLPPPYESLGGSVVSVSAFSNANFDKFPQPDDFQARVTFDEVWEFDT